MERVKRVAKKKGTYAGLVEQLQEGHGPFCNPSLPLPFKGSGSLFNHTCHGLLVDNTMQMANMASKAKVVVTLLHLRSLHHERRTIKEVGLLQ
jgi:hypothetical protein